MSETNENPLASSRDRDARIRERAYHLWEQDGRPHGRDLEYWERADELTRIEESAGAAQLPNPATLPGADPAREAPVEEAQIQENLGEFPNRFTDQGERPQTPSPRLRKAGR